MGGSGARPSAPRRWYGACERPGREDCRLRPGGQLLLGQRARHAVARRSAGRWRRGVTPSPSSSATCPTTPRTATAPTSRASSWCSTATGRAAADGPPPTSAAADVAMVTSYCPEGADAHRVVLESRVAAAGVLRSRHAGHPGAPAPPASQSTTSGPTGWLGFDLVLSYTGGRPSTRFATLWARAGSRRSTAASIPLPSSAPASSPPSAATCPISAPTPRTGRPRWTRCSSSRPAGAPDATASSSAARSIRHELPLDGQHLLRPAPAARRASRLLRVVAPDAERHPRGDGAHGLVPVGAPVRGGGLRHRDPERRLGRARRRSSRPDDEILVARRRPRTCSPRSTVLGGDCAHRPARPRARARLSTPPTDEPRARGGAGRRGRSPLGLARGA